MHLFINRIDAIIGKNTMATNIYKSISLINYLLTTSIFTSWRKFGHGCLNKKFRLPTNSCTLQPGKLEHNIYTPGMECKHIKVQSI